jgi:hypothetical protein
MSARIWFYRVRVSLLGAVLFAVVLYAWNDRRRRHARTSWERPLRVGLVLLRTGAVAPEAFERLEARTHALGERLNAEYRRHRPGRAAKVVDIVGYGPVDVSRGPPQPAGDGPWERVRHTYDLWRYTRQVDEHANMVPRALDARIYLVTQPKRAEHVAVVEGFSESGGWTGVAQVELDDGSVDLALCVAAHELFHLLGATDKYDATGRTRIPEGLPAPDQTPRFPQPGAEVMARNRVFELDREAPPDSLDELYVGPLTAREIGWLEP